MSSFRYSIPEFVFNTPWLAAGFFIQADCSKITGGQRIDLFGARVDQLPDIWEELIAADLDEETAIRFIDRFLMYYIRTADRLTRTSVWFNKLEGGLDKLKDVIIRGFPGDLRGAGTGNARLDGYLPMRMENDGGESRAAQARRR